MKKDHLNNNTLTLIEGCFIDKFREVVSNHNPDFIVELGTCKGGLTKYFVEWFPKTSIYTVDQYWMLSKEDSVLFADNKVTVIITSQMFDEDHILPSLLSLPLKKFLFCDNGYKREEFRYFSGFLKPGDLLGVHDWGEEIHQKDIDDVIGMFDIHPINNEIESTPGLSQCRFFVKKNLDFEKRSNPYKDEITYCEFK